MSGPVIGLLVVLVLVAAPLVEHFTRPKPPDDHAAVERRARALAAEGRVHRRVDDALNGRTRP